MKYWSKESRIQIRNISNRQSNRSKKENKTKLKKKKLCRFCQEQDWLCQHGKIEALSEEKKPIWLRQVIVDM